MRYECIAIYIMASGKNGTLYIGVTSNLRRRSYEHRSDIVDGFTKKYKVHLLTRLSTF